MKSLSNFLNEAYTAVEDRSYVSGWDIKPYIGDAKAIYKSFQKDMK